MNIQEPEMAIGSDGYPIAIGYPCDTLNNEDDEEVEEIIDTRREQNLSAPTPLHSSKHNVSVPKSHHQDTSGEHSRRQKNFLLFLVILITFICIGLAVGFGVNWSGPDSSTQPTPDPQPPSGGHVDPPSSIPPSCYDDPALCPEEDLEAYWHKFPGFEDYGPIEYCGEAHSGLIARGLRNACGFPLRSMRVDALLIGEIAQVIMTQEFQTIPMQVQPDIVEYELPLDEQAAVTAFRAEYDSKVIEGVVKERQEAREEFEAAVDAGLNAYLAEQIRPDIFHISVGNLPPGKVVRVTITYIAPLRSLGSNLMQFVFPTDVAPRFDPWHNSQDPIPEGQALLNNGVVFTLTIIAKVRLFQIYSHTHELEITSNDLTATVHVVDESPLDRDLTISLESIVAPTEPSIYIEESEEHGLAMMLSLVPDILDALEVFSSLPEDGDTLHEFVFIVDRSGSMRGEKMTQLKLALSYILTTLLPGDALFNIVSFGSSYASLFPESQPKQSQLAAALAYVNSFEADIGGTEILLPLQFVLSQQQLGNSNGDDYHDLSRIVFVITDGQVSNTDDVIQYVGAARGSNTRVFSLGLGAHVSRNLVQGIARAGGGTADFVDGDSNEAIWSAVERQMQIALSPAINNIEVEWYFGLDEDEIDMASMMLQQAPYFPPPLVGQRRFAMYFLGENATSLPESMILTATVFGREDQTVSFEVTSDSFVAAPHQSLVIHQMAARVLIQDLEEGRSSIHNPESGIPVMNLAEKVRAEIVRLGVKYQIVSSETSFVAVDYGEEPAPDGGNGEHGAPTDPSGGGLDTSAPLSSPASPPTASAPTESQSDLDSELGNEAPKPTNDDNNYDEDGYEWDEEDDSAAISSVTLSSFVIHLFVCMLGWDITFFHSWWW